MLALCDCNNFFVSCERLAHPELKNRPVVVLSMNDGCVVSRSNEVKAMGIAMGEPYFRIERLLKAKGVAVRSGDLSLYKSVSVDVMNLLSRYTDAMEEYSIDEAFLNLPDTAIRDPLKYSAGIRRAMERCVGIPVSIGVAPTKTLSKLASDLAKKTDAGVMKLAGDGSARVLEETPAGDVWGIGRKSAEHLHKWGVRTAGDFVRKDPLWIKKAMSIRGVITQYELMGHPCIPLETGGVPPKSIQVSRTWGNVLESCDDLERALTGHAVRAGASLRQGCLAAGELSVFVRYGYRYGGEYGYFSDVTRFPDPVSSDMELVGAARGLLRRIYKPGFRYTQGGVTLGKLRDGGYRQLSLFDSEESEPRPGFERFSEAAGGITVRV